ncbi:MAG: chemotaxis protein CheA [Candidatus Omnitrophota bacterium]|jgi:two-component system chemotaxis sensor kinase CheA
MQDSYRELFLTESEEYISVISNCLVKLEENPADLSSLNEIFRCMHTLKGMSATMGFDKLTQLSHHMENLLDELRSQRRKVTSEIIDKLFATVDLLEKLVEEIKAKQESKIDINPFLQELKDIFTQEPDKERVALIPDGQVKKVLEGHEDIEFSEEELKKINLAKDAKHNIYKVKVTISKDCVMREARAYLVVNNIKRSGEIIKSLPPLDCLKEGKFDFSFILILSTKETQETINRVLLTISEIEKVEINTFEINIRPAVAGGIPQSATVAVPSQHYVKKIQSMRLPVERLDKIMNLMGELAIAKIRLMQISQQYKIDPLEDVSSMLDRLISSLQDEIMQTRLLPVAYILDTFPRMVRDLARKQNKQVELEISGSEIELDRVVLDEMSDPLVHLIRNAIDHGIEGPEERSAAGKKPTAKLLIQVSRQKGQIFIEIADDGRGVNIASVKSVALSKGLITPEEASILDEHRVLDLITMPGFSTAKKVTDISGRGVGLDVVKSKIESLGGRLEFETKLGQGSRFILTLPLTLAIIKAMLVKVGNEVFAIPLMSVREIIKIEETELRVIQNFEVARVRDEIIPIIRLQKELDIKKLALQLDSADETSLSVIIIEYGTKAAGLVVNQVLGEQDIVVKPLGALIKRTKGIAGATILGDGKVALILDTMSLR